MPKIGILLHVYHLEAPGWEQIVWGDPSKDQLGTLPKFAQTLLEIPAETEVVSIIYSGPSEKDGLTEGAYARRFLLNNYERLKEFPTLAKKLEGLDSTEYDLFERRLHDLKEGEVITNTFEEVTRAATFFRGQAVNEVWQISAASHAPRCLLNYLVVRSNGVIAREQLWRVIPSDNFYPGTSVNDMMVLEPSHRGDDPMTGYSPTLASVLKPYFKLAGDGKKQLIEVIKNSLDKKS